MEHRKGKWYFPKVDGNLRSLNLIYSLGEFQNAKISIICLNPFKTLDIKAESEEQLCQSSIFKPFSAQQNASFIQV